MQLLAKINTKLKLRFTKTETVTVRFDASDVASVEPVVIEKVAKLVYLT